MATRRRYTKAQKATAVIAAEMSNVTAAAEATGIPATTIDYWMDKPEFVRLREKTREEGAQGFTILMHLAQERLALLIPTMEPRDLIVLAGVATEKSQLLSGHPTERTETRDLTSPFDDHETQSIVAAAREYLGGAGPGEGTGMAEDAAVGEDRPA